MIFELKKELIISVNTETIASLMFFFKFNKSSNIPKNSY